MLGNISRDMEVRKVLDSKCDLQGHAFVGIGAIQYPISILCNYIFILYRFRDVTSFPKFKEAT